MAGRITSVSLAPTAVSRPSAENSCSRVWGWLSATERRISPTELPSALSSFSPPTEGRSTGGILTVAIRPPTLVRAGAERLVVREGAHLLVGDRVGPAR